MRQTGAEVRVCVCGDEGSGKSSLIMSLVKDIFVPHGLQAVLPMITIPPSIGTPENVTTTIVDTSGMSPYFLCQFSLLVCSNYLITGNIKLADT